MGSPIWGAAGVDVARLCWPGHRKALHGFVCSKSWRLWVTCRVTAHGHEPCTPWVSPHMHEEQYPGLFLQGLAFTRPFYSQDYSQEEHFWAHPITGTTATVPTCAALPCVFSMQKSNTWNTECSLQHSPCQQSLNSFSHNSWNVSLEHFRAGICSHVSCQVSVNSCALTSSTFIRDTRGRHQVGDDQTQYLL